MIKCTYLLPDLLLCSMIIFPRETLKELETKSIKVHFFCWSNYSVYWDYEEAGLGLT